MEGQMVFLNGVTLPIIIFLLSLIAAGVFLVIFFKRKK
jgi:hypothetical protein